MARRDNRQPPYYGLSPADARLLVERLESMGYTNLRGDNPRTHFYLGPRVFRAIAQSHGLPPTTTAQDFLRRFPNGPPIAGTQRLGGTDVSPQARTIAETDPRIVARHHVAQILERWEPGQQMSQQDQQALRDAMRTGYGLPPGAGPQDQSRLISTALEMLHGDGQTQVTLNGERRLLREHYNDTVIGLRAQLGLDGSGRDIPPSAANEDQQRARGELGEMMRRWALRGSGSLGYTALDATQQAAEQQRFGDLLRRTGYPVTFNPDAHTDREFHLAHVTAQVTRLMQNDATPYTPVAGGRTFALNDSAYFGGYLSQVNQAAEQRIQQGVRPVRPDGARVDEENPTPPV